MSRYLHLFHAIQYTRELDIGQTRDSFTRYVYIPGLLPFFMASARPSNISRGVITWSDSKKNSLCICGRKHMISVAVIACSVLPCAFVIVQRCCIVRSGDRTSSRFTLYNYRCDRGAIVSSRSNLSWLMPPTLRDAIYA